jgi:outer membrane protein assembly factor BamD (BamD/ComL family)
MKSNKIMKKTITLIILLFTITSFSQTKDYKPYDWKPISGAENILRFEKEVKKNTTKQVELANENYSAAIKLMNNQEYSSAIKELKATQKKYKKARLSKDAYNYLRVNMALCYANTGNKEDLAIAERNLTILTPAIFKENDWSYNIAIIYHLVNNSSEAATILSSLIRNDEFNFQAYVTLEDIYKNSGNQKDADKIRSKMQKAEAKLLDKRNKEKNDPSVKKEKKVFQPKGTRPDVLNLTIVVNDDHLQYNKIKDISERSFAKVNEGIAEYNTGVKELKNKNYKVAQKRLIQAEKKLKMGKINEDGLNFTRGNLAIACLSVGTKSSSGQAKRYLRKITNKIYTENSKWAYNLGVAHYDFSSKSRGTTQKEYLDKAIRLLRIAIKVDKLFLPAHENLIYIYKEMGEGKKALKAQKDYEQRRNELIQTFSRQDQLDKGIGDLYIFRTNLGTFGEYDTPAILFDQEELITVPINDEKTAYLAGLNYNLENAISFQKQMKSLGFENAFIVAYKNGEEIEF